MGPVVTETGVAMTGEVATEVGAVETGTLLPDPVTVGNNAPVARTGADDDIQGTGEIVTAGTLGR